MVIATKTMASFMEQKLLELVFIRLQCQPEVAGVEMLIRGGCLCDLVLTDSLQMLAPYR